MECFTMGSADGTYWGGRFLCFVLFILLASVIKTGIGLHCHMQHLCTLLTRLYKQG